MIVLYSEGRSIFAVALPAVFTRVWAYSRANNNNYNGAINFLSPKVKFCVSQTSAYTTKTEFKNKKQ
jgi:hypothetical protein